MASGSGRTSGELCCLQRKLLACRGIRFPPRSLLVLSLPRTTVYYRILTFRDIIGRYLVTPARRCAGENSSVSPPSGVETEAAPAPAEAGVGAEFSTAHLLPAWSGVAENTPVLLLASSYGYRSCNGLGGCRNGVFDDTSPRMLSSSRSFLL